MAAWYVLPTLPHNFFYLKIQMFKYKLQIEASEAFNRIFLFLITKLFFLQKFT